MWKFARSCASFGAILLFAACGSFQPVDDSQSAQWKSAVFSPANEGSWMRPGAVSKDLVYISEAPDDSSYGYYNEIFVFSYGSAELVGTLTGFYNVRGLCADQRGRVYVLDEDAHAIKIYLHGAVKPKRIIGDTAGPLSCSVDPRTGDLAVANNNDTIYIYRRGQGVPQQYANHTDFGVYCTYNDRSDLFLEDYVSERNRSYYYRPKYAELPKGQQQLVWIPSPQVAKRGTGVLWDGTHLVTLRYPGLLRLAVVRRRLAKPQEITLNGQPTLFWLVPKYGQVVTVSNYSEHQLAYYNYPAGGAPISKFGILGVREWDGITVSLAR